MTSHDPINDRAIRSGVWNQTIIVIVIFDQLVSTKEDFWTCIDDNLRGLICPPLGVAKMAIKK